MFLETQILRLFYIMAKKKIPQQYPNYIIDLPKPPALKATSYVRAYRSWVYTAVTAIAQEVANMHIKLYKKRWVGKELEIDEVTQHESLAVLQHTNDFMTQYQLTDVTQTYLELLGEGYWAKLRDEQGRVTELWPLRPDWVKILPSKENYIKGYRYAPGNGVTHVDFDIKDIVPFRNLNPSDAYRGMGVVQAAAMSLDIDDFSSDWIRRFFYNSAMPGLVFTTDKKLKDQEIERFLTQWQAKFGGVNNSHKIAFLGGGLKPDKLTNSPQDMQFLELKRQMRDEILAMFKVPKAVIGITEDVNRANAEATVRAFMERVIKPRMTKFITYLNEFYLNEWDTEDLFFDYVDPAPADRELDLKVYENALNNGWMTINEVRALENLAPAEGADQIYLPFSMQPIGAVENIGGKLLGMFGKSADKKEGMITLKVDRGDEIQKFNIPIPQKRLCQLRREADLRGVKHDLKKLIMGYVKDAEKKDVSKTMTTEQKEIYWKQMIAKTDVLEDRMRNLLIDRFQEQHDEVLNNINNVKYWRKDHRKGKEDLIVIDEQAETKKWLALFRPFIKNVIADKAMDIFSFLGLSQQINITSDAAVDFLQKQGLEFVTQVNETTISLLKDTLAEGLQAGEGIHELKVRVNSVFESATKSRSEMIARTEILRATNFATVEAYRQSEVVTAKEWLTALDARTCPVCLPLDGQIVPLGKSFSTSVGALDYPPAHPRCRCTTIPIVAARSVVGTQTKKPKEIDLGKVVQKLDEKIHEEKVQDLKDEQAKAKTATQTLKGEAQQMYKETAEEGAILKAKKVDEGNVAKQRIIKKAEEEAEGIIQTATQEVKSLKDKALSLFRRRQN